MICPRGSICTESTHEVKTMGAAINWFAGVKECDLPITVNVHKSSNGRVMFYVRNSSNNLIYKKG